jgi:hypothetical protein
MHVSKDKKITVNLNPSCVDTLANSILNMLQPACEPSMLAATTSGCEEQDQYDKEVAGNGSSLVSVAVS